jgi:hypothetical protein
VAAFSHAVQPTGSRRKERTLLFRPGYVFGLQPGPSKRSEQFEELGQLIKVARLVCVLDRWGGRRHPRGLAEVEELRHIHLCRIPC